MNVDSQIARARLAWFVSGFLIATLGHRAGAQGVLTGTIRNSAGHLVPNALVGVDGLHPVVADSAGRYVVAGIAAGPIRVHASAIGYERFDTTLDRVRGDTTVLVIRLKPAPPLEGPPDVWLGCSVTAHKCIQGRRIANELRGFAPAPAAWYFGDSAAFRAFWGEHALPDRPAPALLPIDWRSERIVAVSYGGYTGCGPERYVNRIEWHR